MKNVKQCEFDGIFYFAEKVYGIHWNAANDIFFGNAFDYNTVSDFYIEDWHAYIDELDEEYEKASDVPVDIVNAMSARDMSYVITSAYFESIGVTGEVQIDSR